MRQENNLQTIKYRDLKSGQTKQVDQYRLLKDKNAKIPIRTLTNITIQNGQLFGLKCKGDVRIQ